MPSKDMRKEATELNVLVVDDDDDLLRTMGDILRMHGCRTETASTGRTGLDLAQRHAPAVALVDLRLPDMDGLELVTRLKEASGTTEVIILTGNASLDSAVGAMRKQSFDYLIKPVRPDDLFRSLDRASQRFFRRRAEAQLRDSEDQLRRIFAAVSDGLFVTDGSGRIVQINEAAGRITGLPPEELVGMTVDRIVQPVERPHASGPPEEGVVHEARIKHTDGRVRHVELAVSEFAPNRFVHTIRDVTRQREIQERLHVSQKMEALGRLAGGVAHDFNNVLTAIRGYADLVHEQCEDPEMADEVDEIRKASDRASALTRQLLAFSRRQVLQPRVLDLGEVVAEMEGMLARLVPDDVTLDFRPQSCLVRADPSQVEQVFLNLVVNARDAMPDGGTILVETGAVQPGGGDGSSAPESSGEGSGHPSLDPSTRGTPHAFVRVTDSGVGIPDDALPNIFEPFFTTKSADKGTGLGLSTIHGIVEDLEGTVHVESRPGRTVFTILLPLAADAPAEAEEAAPVEVLAAEGSEHILLAEDDPAIRRMIVRYLSRAGYSVDATGTAKGAMQRAGSEASFDLLVANVDLPDASGWDLARGLAEAEPDLRVLYVSGHARSEIGRELAPGTAFIRKPFMPKELMDKVRAILEGEVEARPD